MKLEKELYKYFFVLLAFIAIHWVFGGVLPTYTILKVMLMVYAVYIAVKFAKSGGDVPDAVAVPVSPYKNVSLPFGQGSQKAIYYTGKLLPFHRALHGIGRRNTLRKLLKADCHRSPSTFCG